MRKLNLKKIFCCGKVPSVSSKRAPIPSKIDVVEVGGGNRDASPGRYLLKFESFSVLSADGNKKYESNVFQFNGYRWKMIIYPNGDGSMEGRDHISIYLAVVGKSCFQSNWEVNATFSFLIFDQIHGKYVVMRGMEQRFHNIKSEWGFSKCISHETFKEASKGYLVKDRCSFGVDVYVIKKNGVGECLTLLNEIKSYKHEWKISDFTKLKERVYSKEFTVGGYKWKLLLYPTGDFKQNGENISIFLELVDAKGFDSQKRVKAKYSLSVKDQIGQDHRKIMTFSAGNWFQGPKSFSWGWPTFMPLSELNDPKKNFIVGDCCIVEAEVSVLHVVNGLT